jgi:hypothetical protein
MEGRSFLSLRLNRSSFRRYFQPPAEVRFNAGVDLHARSLYLVVLDRDGATRCSRNRAAVSRRKDGPADSNRAVRPDVVTRALTPAWTASGRP